MSRPLTLDEWREQIKINAFYVGKKPFSHNIINIALSAIADKFGEDEANKTIDDFDLERKGWSKE